VPLVTEGLVKLLLDRCVSAPDGGPPTPTFQAMAVTALGRVCQTPEGLEEAIKQGGVLITVNMLEHEMRDVRLNSAFCVASLTLEQDEKAVALKASVMRKCAVMLHEQDAEMQTAAAAMLMSMCNGTRFPNGENACKPEAVKQGIVKALIPLLEPGVQLVMAGEMTEKTSALTVYVTKAMASIADAPEGRKQLKSCLDRLQILAKSGEPFVMKHAQVAIERITWKP